MYAYILIYYLVNKWRMSGQWWLWISVYLAYILDDLESIVYEFLTFKLEHEKEPLLNLFCNFFSYMQHTIYHSWYSLDSICFILKSQSMKNHFIWWNWESQFLGQLIRCLGVPKERGVWSSQSGNRGLGFSRRRKGQTFFPLYSFS